MAVTGVLGWMWYVFMGADGYRGKLLGVGCQKKRHLRPRMSIVGRDCTRQDKESDRKSRYETEG